jgi:hypothetical protein
MKDYIIAKFKNKYNKTLYRRNIKSIVPMFDTPIFS